MLTGYRSTPHPATGVSPYQALMNRQVRTKLDYRLRIENEENTQESEINERDREYKEKMKQNATTRKIKPHNFVVGDYVLLKQTKKNKWSTAYEPAFYIIYKITGSAISARRVTDGREIERDSSKFKLPNAIVQENDEEDMMCVQDEIEGDWRENLLQTAKPEESYPETFYENSDQMKNTKLEDKLIHQPEYQPVINEKPTSTPAKVTRPQRVKQKPVYLKDYV